MPEQLQLHKLREDSSKHYFQNVLSVPDLYRAYRENIFSGDRRAINTQGEYGKIIRMANRKIMEKIVLESKEVTFPFGTGSLSVIKRKLVFSDKARLPTNWKETNKLPKGQFVYHLNEHSNGFVMKFYWDKTRSSIANIGAYSFLATTGPNGNKRFLSKTICGDNPVDYIEAKYPPRHVSYGRKKNKKLWPI